MFTPYWTLALAIQVAYGCIPLTPPPPNSTPAPTEAASEEPEASEAPTTTTTAKPTTTTAKPTEETTKKPENKDCVTVELNPGRPCVFPFTYQYHQHYECLPFKGKFWCALTSLYDKDQWGYCDESLCPPTAAVLTEEPGSTTTTAPATNTINTTAAEAWDDGSTTIAIKTMETYACQVDFQYSLQQGVKIRDVSSVCSGSSSQSNDAVIDKLGNHKFPLKTAEGIELECEVGAVLLEDTKSLSEEVLTSSLKCEAVEADCVTVEGEVYPAQCVIPFNYNGRRYLGCTDRPGSTKLWCPTKTDETGEAEDKFWGYCSRKCGYCGGSPITTRDGQEESCGYDCLIGADWDMVGYDKAPLLKPTIDVSLPTESNYIEEKGGQHQLNIGPQSVTISCAETKFYDPALQQETKLNVQCGPQKYRMTVTSESGVTLGGNFKNDQFGCDPCPSSYSYVPGFLSSEDFSSTGIFYDVKTVQDCKAFCEESCVCQTFDYSKQQSRCQLVKELITKPSFSSSIGDYVLCAKGEDENLCGSNSGLDKTHLIAEKNWPYIAESLNQTGHPNQAYRTHVFEVVTENGDIVMTTTNCSVSDPGLVSLFIAPSSVQCNAEVLGASSSTNGLHHLMISTSCDLDAAIQKFIFDKDNFKQYFNGVPMKLCGARTWMKSVVAESRKATLMDVFSFLYNTEASANSFDLDDASDCKSREETMKTIKFMFDTSDIGFANGNITGTEEEGFVKFTMVRTATCKVGAAFVETTFLSADMTDIVPYSGLVTFHALSDSALLFITIVQDDTAEPDEFFEIEVMRGTKQRVNGEGPQPTNPEGPQPASSKKRGKVDGNDDDPDKGHWGNWEAFDSSTGTIKRHWVCTNPDSCSTETEVETFIIKVNGGWSIWGPWQDCDSKGKRTRTRNCDNPSQMHGGDPCKISDADKDQDIVDCPVPCSPDFMASTQLALDVFTLPVGQGDSTLIRCPGGNKYAIVDAGSLEHAAWDTKEAYVKYLTDLGKDFKIKGSEVSDIFLTHPDEDHANWANALLEKFVKTMDARIHTITFHFGGLKNKWEKTFGDNLLKTIQDNKMLKKIFYDVDVKTESESEKKENKVTICAADNHANEVVMNIITAGNGGEAGKTGHSKNGDSLVMKLTYNGKSMLFMGDLEGKGWTAAMKPKTGNKVKIGENDVIMVPHHGSDSVVKLEKTMTAFYQELIKPKYAIISSHITGSYRHPKASVLRSICRTQNLEPIVECGADTCKALQLIDTFAQGWETYPTLVKCSGPTPVKIFQTTTFTGEEGKETIEAFIIKSSLEKNIEEDWEWEVNKCFLSKK